jgi:hypothetical protein
MAFCIFVKIKVKWKPFSIDNDAFVRFIFVWKKVTSFKDRKNSYVT